MTDVSEVFSVSVGAAQHHRKGAIILLIDDDSAVREVTSSLLRELGYVVMEVGSGGAALDLLSREASVDLVMLDFAMPGMNGMDVARRSEFQVSDASSGVCDGVCGQCRT